MFSVLLENVGVWIFGVKSFSVRGLEVDDLGVLRSVKSKGFVCKVCRVVSSLGLVCLFFFVLARGIFYLFSVLV